MSELTNHPIRHELRLQLMLGVSAAALLALASNTADADDSTTDRPTVWIELGSQLERASNPQEAWNPDFLNNITQQNLSSALNVQKPGAFSIGGEGKISFEPEGSDWVFSASVRYGRSNIERHRHQQTANAKVPKYNFTFDGFQFGDRQYYPNGYVRSADGKFDQSESHAVLDFQVGKDVGLGLFGGHGSATLSGGIRIAQFSSKSKTDLRAVPDLQYPAAPIRSFAGLQNFKYAPVHFHTYSASSSSERSFHGIGPSVSWSASMPVIGSVVDGITLDWGVNGSLLFGRQRAVGHHVSKAREFNGGKWEGAAGQANQSYNPGHFVYRHVSNGHITLGSSQVLYNRSGGFSRVRSVTVPNLGGFAGFSFRYEQAKISFGYRADFFFGAMDGGLETQQSETPSFYGPFASIGIGLGG